ncbi:glycoside hydrolase family 2 TIM barrel-domain containing protein [Streptomyces prunicolor]|uniref:glycoside hydrolase family 2 protein n=1 Tax=Streptomyces prunicolor TaxID=67348 RepID=UPI0037D33946
MSAALGTLAATALGPQDATAEPGETKRYSPPDSRGRIDLDHDWRFHLGTLPGAQDVTFDDSAWPTVAVPHSWNALDGQDGGDDYVRGAGWYRRRLAVPAALKGRRVFLQFDGVDAVADVWVNGHHLGQHRGGYARFRFDATYAVNFGGGNVIAVRASNAADEDVAPLSADYTFCGGIYRSVSLETVGPVHVDMLDHGGPGVYLRQREVSAASASVSITTKLANDSSSARDVEVRAVITDARGRVVRESTSAPVSLPAGGRSRVERAVIVPAPHLWNARTDPYVYRATVEVRDSGTGAVLDVVTQPLGLRSYTVDAGTGVSLNGERLQLRGVNRHQERRSKGWALSPADTAQDFALMHEMGVNALRAAHYQQDQQVYELADRLGIIVYTEVPLINEITDSDAFRDNVRQQLREMIRQNFNHPSVLFWGIGNELGWIQQDKDPQANALLTDLAEIVRTEDPERFSGYAAMTLVEDDDPINNHADLNGYNRYMGWYSGTAATFGTWADALHARHPDRLIGVTEYGAGANIHQHAVADLDDRPVYDGQWHPEEYQALFHEEYLKQIDARPYLWGTFVWSMFDFASDERDEGDQPGINDKGLVTQDRRVKKDAFYWYKANWSDEPVTYVTSRRWTRRTDPAAVVKVYSNAQSVRLTLNGTVVGSRPGAGHVFTWPIRLRPGKNTITAESLIAGKRHIDTVTWVLDA